MLAPILLLAAALAGPPSRRSRRPLKVVASLRPTAPSPGRSWATGERDLDRQGRRGSPLRSAEAELRLAAARRTCSSPPDWISSSGCRRCSTARATARSRRRARLRRRLPGIALLEIPTSLSRSAGDIHVDGNPHITPTAERHHHRPQHPRGAESLAPGMSLLPAGAGLRAAGAGGHHGAELVQILTPRPRSACSRATSSMAS